MRSPVFLSLYQDVGPRIPFGVNKCLPSLIRADFSHYPMSRQLAPSNITLILALTEKICNFAFSIWTLSIL